MSRRALAAASTLSVCGGGAPARAEAATALRERPLARTAALPVGDSRTIAAWARIDGRVDVLLAGRRNVLTVAAPACPRFVAAGARRLLFACDPPASYPPPPRRYIVVDPRTGGRIDVLAPWVGDFPEYTRLGEHWMSGGTSFHTDTESLFLNWRTGALVRGHQDPFGPAYRLDLDRPRLGRRLCRPFQRRQVGTDGPGSLDRFAASPQVEGRWVLTQRQDGYRFLGRCGSSRVESLGRDATLGSGHAIYTRAGVTRLRRLHDGRAYHLRAPAGVLPVGGRAVVRRDGRLTLVSLPR